MAGRASRTGGRRGNNHDGGAAPGLPLQATTAAFCALHRRSFLQIADELAVPGAFVMGMGRLANFVLWCGALRFFIDFYREYPVRLLGLPPASGSTSPWACSGSP